MRVQFTVNSNEWKKLEQLASANGYPDVPSFCRDESLNQRSYAEMWDKIKKEIIAMPSGKTFALRDIIKCPPSNLGVKLYENQSTLGIRVNPKKDHLKTNTFTKL